MEPPAPEHERVWVLVDGVGQPCLHHIQHRHCGPMEPEPSPVTATDEYGPYRWEPYILTPAPQEIHRRPCGRQGCGKCIIEEELRRA